MKTFKAKTGPFVEQPFYELAEIETICADELRRFDLYPSDPAPVRIDRFIEKRFNVRPAYADLPNGLLGFTLFGEKGVAEIVVTRSLDDEGTVPAERRLRSTLAHEGGHGLLHAHLFAFGQTPYSLFGDGIASDAPKILCRKDGMPGTGVTSKKPPYRWWEFQANQAMGALLLPKTLVEKAIASELVPMGHFGRPTLANDRRDYSIKVLSDTFAVNPIVARIRLDGLFPPGAQLPL